jgi:UDPglucose 6-dehydrogenase
MSVTGGRDARRVRHSVAVIGAGYVGLPTAATLAHFGHRVVLAEREPGRLAALRSGRMPIVEVGLDDLVAGSVAAGNLTFVESAVDAVPGAAFVFLCVPTPQSADGSADLSYVEAAPTSVSSPTPSSCERARPCSTACTRTGSWSERTIPRRRPRWASCSLRPVRP